jgi:hypothetical protein
MEIVDDDLEMFDQNNGGGGGWEDIGFNQTIPPGEEGAYAGYNEGDDDVFYDVIDHFTSKK